MFSAGIKKNDESDTIGSKMYPFRVVASINKLFKSEEEAKVYLHNLYAFENRHEEEEIL